jgi:hypothetical protein
MPEELLSDEDDPSPGSGFLTLLLDDLLSLRGFEDDEELFLLLLVSTLLELENFFSLELLLDNFLSLRGVEDDKAIFLLLLDDSPSAGSVTLSLLLEFTSPELDSPNSD